MPSQFGQDAIIQKIFDGIGTTNKFCVEFGHNSKDYDSANTGHLCTNCGWKGLLMDGSNENPDINLHKEFITSKNIVSLFAKYEVPLEPDYVSIDLDSTDLWVFRSIVSSKYRPRVISVEYNCYFPWGWQMTIPDDSSFEWKGDHVYGASLAALDAVAVEFGYTLVDVESPCDAFFVRSDIQKTDPDFREFWPKTGLVFHGALSQEQLGLFIDYRKWRRENFVSNN